MEQNDHEREISRVMTETGELVAELIAEPLGDILPEGFEAQMIGTTLAIVDALFAIRNGDAWRDETDPQKIAEKLLRSIGLAE